MENEQNTLNDSNQNNELQNCQTERDEWKDRALRISADFENFKKRTEKERAQLSSLMLQGVLLDIIATVDDFDRALAQDKNPGFALIYKNLLKTLEKYGVQEMKDFATFEPSRHEAIMQVESETHKAGDIVQVLQKGYMLKDQVLRPAKVSVAKECIKE